MPPTSTPNFVSKLRPPNNVALVAPAREASTQLDDSVETGVSPYKPKGVSFNTPREVWSPLLTAQGTAGRRVKPTLGITNRLNVVECEKGRSPNLTSTNFNPPAPGVQMHKWLTPCALFYQRPKYQLCDPGVSSPSTRIPNSVPTPSRVTTTTRSTTSKAAMGIPKSRTPGDNANKTRIAALTASSAPSLAGNQCQAQNQSRASHIPRPRARPSLIRSSPLPSNPSSCLPSKIASSDSRATHRPGMPRSKRPVSTDATTSFPRPGHPNGSSQPRRSIHYSMGHESLTRNDVVDPTSPLLPELDITSNLAQSVLPSRQTTMISSTSSLSMSSSASSLARHQGIRSRTSLNLDTRGVVPSTMTTPERIALARYSSSGSSLSTMSDRSIKTDATVASGYPIDSLMNDDWTSPSDRAEEVYERTPLTGQCAPYLVDPAGPKVTLEWESDPESGEIDEAEQVWKNMEIRMGRSLRGGSMKRGRWVVKTVADANEMSLAPTPPTGGHRSETLLSMSDEMSDREVELPRSPSEFSLSAYLPPTPPVRYPADSTALFDMSAPLIPSVSTSACTPANTPCMRKETLRRVRRVRRRGRERADWSLMDSDESSDSWEEKLTERTMSWGEDEGGEVTLYPSTAGQEGHRETGWYTNSTGTGTVTEGRSDRIIERFERKTLSMSIHAYTLNADMYRLDSQVISALGALQAVYDSPELDHILGLEDDLDVEFEKEGVASPILSCAELRAIGSRNKLPCSGGSAERVWEEGEENGEGGLGLGIPLHLDTVYSLPVLSPLTRARPRFDQVLKHESPIDEWNQGWDVAAPGRSQGSSRDGPCLSVYAGDDHQDNFGTVSATRATDNTFEMERGNPGVDSKDGHGSEEVLCVKDLDTGLSKEVKVGDDLGEVDLSV
ncbi:hypothetical protein IAR55_001980 [Kwoniella newhampshirensis]|uniref:Uncharacterized protein n=1 Tax=Kwoniella newhampshirensis TaxID=1651941 RepID=A0AAW0Z3Q9_9TREE